MVKSQYGIATEGSTACTDYIHTYILMNKGERKWQGVISPNLFEDIGELQMLQ